MASTHDLKVQDLFSVKDYVCLVTGGGTGIGLMATQALAANGAKVYITGRRLEVLQNAAESHDPSGGQIIPIGPCDVTSKSDLERLAKDLSSKEKHLNLFIANAGISGPKAPPDTSEAQALKDKIFDSESFEEWQSVQDSNVTSVYFSTLAFLPLLQASMDPQGPYPPRSASVIVISSISGLMRHSQGHFAYNAAKGATVHLSKMLSFELEKTSIRVNSIAPGYFPSELTMKESNEKNKTHMPAEKVQDKGHPVPAARPGHDQEMAQGVIFLAKNQYVNGQIIPIDGGVINQMPT